MMGVLNHLSTLLLLSLLPPALSHVVVKFSDVPQCKTFFLEGTTPNLTGVLVGGTVQNQNRYKPICQLYNNIYRFATLYDTINRIPVFSAYTFTGDGGIRPSQSWMMEPQLEDIKDQRDMKVNNTAVTHQAVNKDYNNRSLHRGHLFPCSHAPDNDTKKSTSTLTNAVPRYQNFNQGRWRIMEGKVRDALVKNCNDTNNRTKAYVVTGAVPSKNNTLNNRVNIPYLMWTAFCCYNNTKNWTVGAYWGENTNGSGSILNLETLGKLEAKLNQSYNGTVKVFHDNCPRNITVQQVNTRTREETESECVEMS
ncbi:endonuclease domain-containing 1 protein-like [Oncorhynchus nerka]|uniref:endonuclease domain-containing 1 protein-like n=1 Tax=Oncorhynchus nerka TaxID=8023 RepID=UPI0031B875D1